MNNVVNTQVMTLVRLAISWHDRARANDLPPSVVGGVPLPRKVEWPTEPIDGTRNDRVLRPLTPDFDYEPVTESEQRLMDGNR